MLAPLSDVCNLPRRSRARPVFFSLAPLFGTFQIGVRKVLLQCLILRQVCKVFKFILIVPEVRVELLGHLFRFA